MSSETRPAAPRLTRRGQETRQRIIDSAARLIFDQGVASTTIEHVRAAAKVSASQLYHHFEDKTALVLAVIEHQADAIVGNQQRFSLNSLEGLREWRDAVVEHQRAINCRGGCPIGSLGGELAETEPRARAKVAESFKRWEAAIQAGLGDMQARGRLAPEADPDDLAVALLAALQGGLRLTQIQRETKPLEIILDAMLAHIAALASISRC